METVTESKHFLNIDYLGKTCMLKLTAGNHCS